MYGSVNEILKIQIQKKRHGSDAFFMPISKTAKIYEDAFASPYI